jgi:hypothetical protein
MRRELFPQLPGFDPKEPFINPQEYLRKTVEAFYACVDFLRKPIFFPNQEINKLVTLLWRLIGNKEIPLVLDDKWGSPKLIFSYARRERLTTGLLILPEDFLKQVNENPIYQLGRIVFNASKVRDYYTGKITEKNEPEIERRARGYEAEALLTLQKMAEERGGNIEWTPYQENVLREYPQGIASLPRHLVYSTPVWQPPRYG